ncbi:unnamed protein product [Cunninghamella blakesleeana]
MDLRSTIQSQAAVIKRRDHKEPKTFYPLSTSDAQKEMKMMNADNGMNTNKMMMTEVWYPSYGKSDNGNNGDHNKKNMNGESTTSSNPSYGETLNSGRRFRYVDDVSTPPSASSLSSLSTDSTKSSSSSSSEPLPHSKAIENPSDLSSTIENINIKQKSETRPKKLMDLDDLTDDLTNTDDNLIFILDDSE